MFCPGHFALSKAVTQTSWYCSWSRSVVFQPCPPSLPAQAIIFAEWDWINLFKIIWEEGPQGWDLSLIQKSQQSCTSQFLIHVNSLKEETEMLSWQSCLFVNNFIKLPPPAIFSINFFKQPHFFLLEEHWAGRWMNVLTLT